MLATHRSELGRARKLLLWPISDATCPLCCLPCYGGVKKIEMPVPFVHDLGVGPTHLTPWPWAPNRKLWGGWANEKVHGNCISLSPLLEGRAGAWCPACGPPTLARTSACATPFLGLSLVNTYCIPGMVSMGTYRAEG